jgi:hypothetical protein
MSVVAIESQICEVIKALPKEPIRIMDLRKKIPFSIGESSLKRIIRQLAVAGTIQVVHTKNCRGQIYLYNHSRLE